MKIYILTCINEESTLVSCEVYKMLLSAQADMICSAMSERDEFEKIGRPGNYCNIKDMSASVGDEEYCYIFNITEKDLGTLNFRPIEELLQ